MNSKNSPKNSLFIHTDQRIALVPAEKQLNRLIPLGLPMGKKHPKMLTPDSLTSERDVFHKFRRAFHGKTGQAFFGRGRRRLKS